MGAYYFLLNDTKNERVHLDWHVKRDPLTKNLAVHFAICNYMMENVGDNIRVLSDSSGEDCSYNDVDLLKRKFIDDTVMPTIVKMLNEVYQDGRYSIVEGVGVNTVTAKFI